jgi:hypothetical protein
MVKKRQSGHGNLLSEKIAFLKCGIKEIIQS